MTLAFFNTLSRTKEPFIPLKSPRVTLYTCGPTIYAPPHIGNYRTYVWQDLLRRWLIYRGYRVEQVMNLTDVDDKTIRGAQKKGIPLQKFTEPYGKLFFDDLKQLRIQPAEHFPTATTHIPEMVALLQTLLEKDIAYRGEDGSIYFSIKKFPSYGKLAHLDAAGLKSGARVSQDEYTKESASDFVLWKAWDEQDGDVFWDTPVGKGRPGWHLECSAMAMKYLGPTLDIHAGGIDLVFPHHQNEVAQSEAATGKQFSRFWLHGEHLRVNGEKMAKSLGNFFTLADVLKKGHSPLAVRLLLLSGHYRSPLNFTFEGLAAAQKTNSRLEDFVARLREQAGDVQPSVRANLRGLQDLKTSGVFTVPGFASSCLTQFDSALDDDLNTPEAFSALFSLETQANAALARGALTAEEAAGVLSVLSKMDDALGFLPLVPDGHEVSPSLRSWVEQKMAEREDARGKKDFARADSIRKELAGKGIVLEDTPKGARWKQAK